MSFEMKGTGYEFRSISRAYSKITAAVSTVDSLLSLARAILLSNGDRIRENDDGSRPSHGNIDVFCC